MEQVCNESFNPGYFSEIRINSSIAKNFIFLAGLLVDWGYFPLF